ncbi:MAG: hypothetical protein CTY12_00060 [Methylotenera sp.]|nr:MAG: hypothetical protein CTY12_00060 [Methylotenera sp.]
MVHNAGNKYKYIKRENGMLIGKFVISPIDGQQYCRKNGQFLRHLISNGYAGYQDFYEQCYPQEIQRCECGNKCLFDVRKMKYKQTCGTKECANTITSIIRQNRTDKEWEDWKLKYKETMLLKTEEELQQLYQTRSNTGHISGNYKTSVNKRQQTCKQLYDNETYNNPNQISQTKLEWDESRKQLFKDRLAASLGGKILNDFHTEEMYVARRKMLEERGDIIPLDQLTEWQKYSKKVRNLTEQVYRKHKSIINPLNLLRQQYYYELDHIVPVFYGFLNQIPEYLIASVENLQLLKMEHNRTKGRKYDPTISTKHQELENKNS